MTDPVSPAPAATPANEARSTPRPETTAKDPEALRDRFTQVMAKRTLSPFDEMEDFQALKTVEQNHAAIAGETSLPKLESSGKDDKGAADRLPETHSVQTNNPQEMATLTQPGSKAAGQAGPAMDAALLRQFAEHMALPGTQSHQTTLTLDPGQFRVAEVRIEGQASEGLSITLKNHSDSRNGGHDGQEGHPLETLRARLLARAIPVTNLDLQV